MITRGLSGPRPDSAAQITGSGLPLLASFPFLCRLFQQTFPVLYLLPLLPLSTDSTQCPSPAQLLPVLQSHPVHSCLQAFPIAVPSSAQNVFSHSCPLESSPRPKSNFGATLLVKPSLAVLGGMCHTLPASRSAPKPVPHGHSPL